MSQIDIDQLLSQMRTMRAQAQGVFDVPSAAQAEEGPQAADFSTLLKSSIDQVNEAQKHAGQMAEAFEKGDPQTDLSQVMVALQKANLSFQAMTEVRNKLVSAYQEIMNMQV